eukprot:TRINITY_DN427_c0_g1_i3.p1 TRINITY_DN427_c0_g1~~TRINITY_DN427_c0_g1_i3.p1  ORF type:complete len:1386 (-),score=362.76 TRINITY_DN427_c0_g1_i3:113-4270(-)
MRRFLFLALFITLVYAQGSSTWIGFGADRKVTTTANWLPAPPTTTDAAVFADITNNVEFPTGAIVKWGSIDYTIGTNLTFVMSPNSALSFGGTYPNSAFIARWQLDAMGPVLFDATRIQAGDVYANNNFGGAYVRDNSATFSTLGPIPVTSNFKFGTGNTPRFIWQMDFRSKTPITNLTLPNEMSWTLGDLDVAPPGEASIDLVPLPLVGREFAKTCSASCSVYEECCVVNVTLSGVATINGPFTIVYDPTIRLNFASSSTANVALNKNFTFQSAQVSIGGTWQIASGISLLATSLPIPALGATATRAELAGSITGGTVTLTNYDQLLVQSTVDLNTKVEFTGNQVDFYGTELSGATLYIFAATIAAHLDETNVNIGTLNLLTDITLTQGFIRTSTLTGSSFNFYVSSGASLTVDTFLNSPTIFLESFSSILAVTSPNYAFEALVQGSKSLLLVDNAGFIGEDVPGNFPLRIGESAIVTYGSGTTAVSRQLEMYGGTLQFSAASVTIDHLVAKFRSNATISGGVINVLAMEITASKIVNKVLVIDTNTRLNIIGSLNVSIPTGSVATLGGAGVLDASQGTIEIWSGKLIIQSDFVGSVTVRGGSVEFQTLTPSTSHNVTSVIMNGGNVESTLSAYTLPVLQWRSGSIKASKTLGIQQLVILGTDTKAITAGSILNITSIDISESTGFDAPDTVVINNVGEFYLPSGISLNGGQSNFNNYGSVIISKSAVFTCSRYLNSPNAVGVSNLARRSVAQSIGTGAVTVINGGTIAGTVTNSAYLQATGTINGDLLNRGQIYVGNFTEDNKGLLRQLNISGTFDNTGTSTITPQVILKIAGPTSADTDLLQANVMSLGGTLNLTFTFPTKGVDVLTSWFVIETTSYSNQFASVAADNFQGQGRLVYTLTGAQWEFVGCHNEKTSCTTCIKQTGDSFPNGCDWCKTAGVCRGAGTCGASDAIDVITISEEGQCPDAPVNTLLYLLFIPGALVLGGGIVVLVVFLKRRNRVGGSADAVLLKKKPGPPEFLPIAFGPSMMESKLSKKDKDLVPALERLKDLLLEDNMEVVMAITDNDVIKAVDLDKTCQALTYVFESVGRYPHLLNALVDREVELHHSDEASLLRGNTVATISWKFYSKLVGLEYLWNTLSDGIYLLVEKTSSGEISTEMDPVLLGEEEDVKVNKYQLMLTAQQILSKITKSVEHVPLPMKFICHHLQERVMAKYPSMRYTSVGGFIFLRYLNPAINLPEAYGLTRKVPSKEARRVFVLLTKTLQSLANGIKLGGKEQHMAKLNDFIDENQNEINQFFDQCAILPEGSSEADLKPVEIPHYILLVCMAEIHRHIHYSVQRIKEKLSKEKLDQLMGIMNEIGGPIKIENASSKDSKVDPLLAGLK